MKVPESISMALLIVGLFLILNGTFQKRTETLQKEVNGTEIVISNANHYGLNMRKFVGILCLVGGVVAGIAGMGLTTVVQGGIPLEDLEEA